MKNLLEKLLALRVKISFLFAWYDMWIGWFWDSKKQWLYFFPIPTCGFIFKFHFETKGVIVKPNRDPKEMAMEIARLIHGKFKNWCTPDQVWNKFKNELNNVDFTTSIFQTLVFYKLAIVKQLPDQRAQFKITITHEIRKHELHQTIVLYQSLLVNLESELKNIEKHTK